MITNTELEQKGNQFPSYIKKYSKDVDTLYFTAKNGVHKGAQECVKALNALYKKEKALHQKQFSAEGFEWINHGDHENSVISYIRKGNDEKDNLIIILNLTPIPRENYRIGVPKAGTLKEVFSSDAKEFNGTGDFSNKKVTTDKIEWNFKPYSAEFNLPPLGMMVFKYSG